MIDDYGNECRGEVERLRARVAELEAQWASVPWEAIFLLHNTSHMAHRAFHNLHDVTVIDYLVAWAKKHAQQETAE